jgi:hypothetical protein
VIVALVARAETSIRSMMNSGYEAAVRDISRIGALRRKLGRETEHAEYVADLASRHKMKRNFMRLLNAEATVR